MKDRVLIINNSLIFNQKANEYLILNSPNKDKLEEILFNENFSCIIPLDAIIQSEKETYNVLKLLEEYNYNYFGNSYLKNIISQEKEAFIKQTGLQFPNEIWSKTNKRNYDFLSNSDFPILLCNNNYSNLFYSKYEISSNLDNLIQKYKTFTVYKNYNFDKIFHTLIIGNIPNIIFATNCDEEKEIELLREKSIELFSKLDLKDFACFVFGEKSECYYLLDINLNKIANNDIIKLMEKNYNIDIYQIVTIYAIISLNKSDIGFANIERLCHNLPYEVLSKIISFECKKKLNFHYDYKEVCRELKKRFLSSSDANRNEFVKLIEKTVKLIPKASINSYYLGELEFNYENYLAAFERIPNNVRDQEQVLSQSLQVLNGQIRWNSPLSFYNVCPPTMMNTVAAATITNMYNPNGMIDKTSAGYLSMEKQIIRQLSNLLDINPDESAGVFTSGGKVCITYAIKCGLNRCQREYSCKNPPVIITSQANHFSIEAAGYQLGINRTIRIELTEKQELDINKFEHKIKECMENRIPIACIILSGGNTLHAAVENVRQVKDIVNKYIKDYNVSYAPYIYYDLVVCWPWLFYKNYDFSKNILRVEKNVLSKIRHTSDIFRFANLADGFGFDFHKGGFSPYTTSVFITKCMNELYSINNEKGELEKDSCYHTFTNSRTTTDIISAWNVLQSVGVEGFQSYVANMLNVASILSHKFKDLGFNILYEKYTFGFATIIWIKAPTIESFSAIIESNKLAKENDKYIYEFTEYLKRNNIASICVRYLPKYNYKNKKITVLSLLPMTMNLEKENVNKIAELILEIKKDFDEKYIQGKDNFKFDIAPENVPR